MKCISVYTNDFEVFSDIYEKVLNTPFEENEEKQVEGVTVMESGDVPDNYLDRMKTKPEVVVMKVRDRDITILQHKNLFEIFIPTNEIVVH
ncbi:NAD/NADP transhydrogenase alpha subunit [Paenibacillus xerothermodurans]|uniref:NAD/NADP transhydrogenase alpha subunit n=1 Tax=Paenibacillus xerothermodurans TaxID=1977292 RepID=A0A2W1NE53_PAEXE|nr:NAD/NADP transhydrogenase alpha subunit [Paenibacillus xerothermodurans]PZE21900.1 NAD/NADP transhydrogenase alpha subunit [Paenibacillus xerothermodurans]